MAPDLPSGEYAVVELFGHTTLVGRVTEVQPLGSLSMFSIETVFRDQLLPPVLHAPRTIYRMTFCTPEQAIELQAASLDVVPLVLHLLMPRSLYEEAARDRAAVKQAALERKAAAYVARTEITPVDEDEQRRNDALVTACLSPEAEVAF